MHPAGFEPLPRCPGASATISLITAWLCASGAMLDVAQVFAWGRMFAGYARTESLSSAARETFDPGKPCAICRAVAKAREADCPHSPAPAPAGAEKMVMIDERAAPFVGSAPHFSWPSAPVSRASARDGDVPVPPPKSRLA